MSLSDVCSSPNLVAGAAARGDLQTGLVDERLVVLLAALLARHRLELSVVKTGHPLGPTAPSGRQNDHFFYRAVDIVAVDEEPLASTPTSAGALAVGRHLMSLTSERRPARVMGPAAWLEALGPGDRTGFREDAFATEIHADHLHIGF